MKKLLYLFGLLGLMSLASCRTQERVVEVVRTDTLIIKDVQRDSVYIESLKHDSVYIHQKGDTVLIEKWHTEWRDRWREREKHDTLYVAKHDTIKSTSIITNTKTEKAKLSWWQQLRITLGDILLIVLVFVALFWGVKSLLKKVVRP